MIRVARTIDGTFEIAAASALSSSSVLFSSSSRSIPITRGPPASMPSSKRASFTRDHGHAPLRLRLSSSMATMTIGLVGVTEPASRSVKSYAVELSCAKYVVHESRRIDTATKPLAPTARRTGFIGAVLYNDGRQYNCCKEQTWHGFRSSPPR